jgi:superfamily II DNA or RNA helicase
MLVDYHNSYAKITEYNSEEEKYLRNKGVIVYRSYVGKKPVYEKTVNLITKEENSLIVPIGFIENIIDKMAEDFDIEVTDYRVFPRGSVRCNSPDVKRRDFQIEIKDILESSYAGVFDIPPGSGKTLSILDAFLDKRVRTLVIVPTTKIRDAVFKFFVQSLKGPLISKDVKPITQTAISYSRSRDINDDIKQELAPEQKYLIKKGFKRIGGKLVKTEKSVKEKDPKMPDIVVVCYQAAAEYSPEQLAQFEMILIDEGHTSSSESIRYILDSAINAPYRFFFTGTAWRDRSEDNRVFQHYTHGKTLLKKTYLEMKDAGHLRAVKIVELQAPKPDEFLKDVKGFDNIIKLCIVANRARNKMIFEKAVELFQLGHRVLICVTEAEHALIFEAYGENENIPVMSYFSNQDDSKKREIEDITENTGAPCIIVATMALGIGADTKHINRIIMADIRKGKGNANQRGGRGHRNTDDSDLEIYLVVDWFNQTTVRWFCIIKSFLNSYYKK